MDDYNKDLIREVSHSMVFHFVLDMVSVLCILWTAGVIVYLRGLPRPLLWKVLFWCGDRLYPDLNEEEPMFPRRDPTTPALLRHHSNNNNNNRPRVGYETPPPTYRELYPETPEQFRRFHQALINNNGNNNNGNNINDNNSNNNNGNNNPPPV